MDVEKFLNFRNEWLIANLKKEKYKYGLRFIPSLYLKKYTGKKFLNKLKRYLTKLLRWEGAFSYKFFRYHTQEASIRGEEMKHEDTQFYESLNDITSAVDHIHRLIRQLQEGPLYKEWIEELEIEKIFG